MVSIVLCRRPAIFRRIHQPLEDNVALTVNVKKETWEMMRKEYKNQVVRKAKQK